MYAREASTCRAYRTASGSGTSGCAEAESAPRSHRRYPAPATAQASPATRYAQAGNHDGRTLASPTTSPGAAGS